MTHLYSIFPVLYSATAAPHAGWNSLGKEFRTKNASAEKRESGHCARMPRSLSDDRKNSTLNHRRLACDGKAFEPAAQSCLGKMKYEGAHERLGRPMSPSYFMISYSRIMWSRQVFQVSCETRRWS